MVKRANSHAAKRMAERYGVEMSGLDMRALVRRLAAGEGIVLDKSLDAERRLICVGGKEVVVVWKPASRVILTVLPKKRKLPVLMGRRRGRNGKTKSEGKRPEREVEW